MDAAKTHWRTAVSVGEEIVDNNPTACMPKYMKQLELRFGGSRAIWFSGIVVTALLSLYLIGGLKLMANIIGFGFPARASFKAIDSPNAHESAQWLSYWAIFGAFFTLENALCYMPAGVPYYNILKALVLVYCFHPATKGATLAYDNVIRPLVIQHVMPGSSQARGHRASPSAAASNLSSSVKNAVSSAANLVQTSVSRGSPSVTVPQVSDLISPEHSELRVVVISASDIVPTEAPGAGVDCDPYCVLEVLPEGLREKDGAAEKTKYKTVCKTGTANPVWNEGVTIPQVNHLDAKLVVTVCSKRAMGRDECLGKIEVPLSDDKIKGSNGPADIVQALSPAEGTQGSSTGDLRITVQLQ